MSREATGDVPLGAGATGGNRLVSEPAFELLFSEIIAYTGAYVSHSAASHATDMFRAAEAGGGEEDGGGEGGGDEGDDDGATGALVEPSPASVGAGNRPLPVSLVSCCVLLLHRRTNGGVRLCCVLKSGSLANPLGCKHMSVVQCPVQHLPFAP